jgi:hypothetical protein
MMLTNLADIARSTGHPVTEVPGWRTRTRPSTPAGLIDVQTITIHETGLGHVPTTDMPSLDTLVRGRGGRNPLPGPLAQFGIGYSGRIYVVAAGLANHAGVSLETRFNREHAIGIEIEASGLGLPGDFPPVQLDAAARLAAALQRRYTAVIRGHKETCKPIGRKVDPHFDMPQFRRRADRLAGTRPTTEDDEMSLSPADVDKIAEAVWARQHKATAADVRAFGAGVALGDKKSEEELLRFSPAVARLRRETAAQIGALTGLVEALVEQIVHAGGLTPAQAETAAERGAELALEELARRISITDDPVT